jgi:hypothetical protein
MAIATLLIVAAFAASAVWGPEDPCVDAIDFCSELVV